MRNQGIIQCIKGEAFWFAKKGEVLKVSWVRRKDLFWESQ
jgi:preprotein translocase subunit SecE